MIKPTLYILLALSLAACAGGDCEPQAAVSPAADVVTASPATPPTPTPATPTPTPAPAPLPTPAPEPITDCPKSNAATVCPPSPTPAPVRPIVIDPNPTPTCVRDASIALVYVDPFWVDNCGNKYSNPTTN